MKLFILFIALIVSGCSTIKNSETYAKKGEWESTFTSIAVSVNSGSQESILKAQELVSNHPRIKEYSLNLFSEQNINDLSESNENIEYLRFRLKTYCIINSQNDCDEAVNRLNIAQKNIKPSINTLLSLFNQLTAQEKQKLLDKYRVNFLSDSEIGIVTDRQVQNLSTPGSNAGAEIGGAVGTTAYINNATPSSYSMKSDLTSTALGALAGAILLNRSPTEQYLIRYTLKLRNGEIMQVDQASSSPMGQGIGICVYAPNASLIDQSMCTMDLAEFKFKFSEINYKLMN